MFDFFKRKAPQWNDLSQKQKRAVTSKIAKSVKALTSGPHYKIVQGTDEWQRGRGMVEYHDEDEILNAYGRGKLLDLARNATRNSSSFNAILKQLDLNIVGTNGGKLIADFEDAEQIKTAFSRWTREADFFDGLSFNSILKLILKTYVLGGDMVLMFDDGLIEDSGRLVIYEPDEIGSTTEEAIKQHFGQYARQSLGRIYNGNGRFIGAVVSRSQRGKEEFDPHKSYFLRRDPNTSWFDSLWMMPRNVFRVSQGRGISPLTSSLATILDLEDLCSFELAAAKKNAQTLAQVLQSSSPSNEDAAVPSAFDDGTDFSNMTAEEIEEAVKEEQPSEVTMTLDKVAAAGAVYQVMPENYKMEILDTKHPNSNMPDFINWLAGRAASPFGLTREFATLAPSGSDFRANQLFSKRAFEDGQKFLEGIADWVVYRWSLWASKKNIISKPLSLDEMQKVDWSWPKMDELDELQYQNAVEKKLRNMTGSYRDILGPDWKETLETVKNEIDWCKKNNLPHPSYSMVSGGERTGAGTTNTEGNEQ